MNDKLKPFEERLRTLKEELDSRTSEDIFAELTECKPNNKSRLRCVGRLKRNCYMAKGKLVSNYTFTLLKRKSQLLLEDLIDDAAFDIDSLNFGNYEDGVYEIITIGGDLDWETGVVDDWELILVPYKEEEDYV